MKLFVEDEEALLWHRDSAHIFIPPENTSVVLGQEDAGLEKESCGNRNIQISFLKPSRVIFDVQPTTGNS